MTTPSQKTKAQIYGGMISIVCSIVAAGLYDMIKTIIRLIGSRNTSWSDALINAILYRASTRSYASIPHYISGYIIIIVIGIAVILAITLLVSSAFYEHNAMKLKTLEISIKHTRRIRRYAALLCSIIMLALLGISYISTFVFLPFEMWEEFELILKVLTPFVEEKDIALLRAQWILMKNQNQYEEICTYINKTLQEVGIVSTEQSINDILWNIIPTYNPPLDPMLLK